MGVPKWSQNHKNMVLETRNHERPYPLQTEHDLNILLARRYFHGSPITSAETLEHRSEGLARTRGWLLQKGEGAQNNPTNACPAAAPNRVVKRATLPAFSCACLLRRGLKVKPTKRNPMSKQVDVKCQKGSKSMLNADGQCRCQMQMLNVNVEYLLSVCVLVRWFCSHTTSYMG